MSSVFGMIDVGSKSVTHRIAVASGEIRLSEKVCLAIAEKRVPKGDVLALAEVAGISAAKRTADILPLCHPLLIDSVHLNCELDGAAMRVKVLAEVRSHGKTGVEMEALTAASAALLCIYDLTKALDKGAVISEIKLESKSGGKSGKWQRGQESSRAEGRGDLAGLKAAVLTVSDRCSRGETEDKSGELLAQYLEGQGATLSARKVLADDVEAIRATIEEFSSRLSLDVVLVSGGTGVGPRDLTPEALSPLWTRVLPGFGEAFRSLGMQNTPRAWLSRAEAGVVGKTFVVLLPGSPAGVADGLKVLSSMTGHIVAMIRGGGH